MIVPQTPSTLADAARLVLQSQDTTTKIAQTRALADAWHRGDITEIGTAGAPKRPGRPEKPALLAPREMPKRSFGTVRGRAAFIHAIAHIELNAVDLAWDIIARFACDNLPSAFYDDWVETADDEARHFQMLAERLTELDVGYGDLPAHDGLWQAAEDTADDLLARLALVPMVLEARGLDTTPAAVDRLTRLDDPRSAEILDQIGTEEVPHVAAGVRWFKYLCEKRNLEPIAAFHDIVRTRFKATLKAPFNEGAREAAGMSRDFYMPLSE